MVNDDCKLNCTSNIRYNMCHLLDIRFMPMIDQYRFWLQTSRLWLWFRFSAEEAGITIMNEVGVDPGIDHMLAIQCFENVEEHGGKVRKSGQKQQKHVLHKVHWCCFTAVYGRSIVRPPACKATFCILQKAFHLRSDSLIVFYFYFV